MPLEPSAAAVQVLDAFDNFFQKFHQGRFMDRMHVVILLMSNWCCILQVQTLNPKCLIMRASCDDVVSFFDNVSVTIKHKTSTKSPPQAVVASSIVLCKWICI